MYNNLQWMRKSVRDCFQSLKPLQKKPTPWQEMLGWVHRQFQRVMTCWQEKVNTISASEAPVGLLNAGVKPSGKEAFFEPEPSRVTFRQRVGTSTCYVLSGLGGIFRHPQAKEILERIPVYKVQQEGKEGFEVHFPGQGMPVFVPASALNQGVHSDYSMIQILERAYLSLKDAGPPGEWDESAQAFHRMFGQEGAEIISIQNSRDISGLWLSESDRTKELKELTEGGITFTIERDREPDHYIGGQKFFHEDRMKVFADYLSQTHQTKNNPQSLDVLTAIQHGGGHYYTILAHESYYDDAAGQWMVRLADPFHFEPDKFFTVPMDTLMKEHS